MTEFSYSIPPNISHLEIFLTSSTMFYEYQALAQPHGSIQQAQVLENVAGLNSGLMGAPQQT